MIFLSGGHPILFLIYFIIPTLILFLILRFMIFFKIAKRYNSLKSKIFFNVTIYGLGVLIHFILWKLVT